MVSSFQDVQDRFLGIAMRLDWVPRALLRLTLGVVFSTTGWGKVHSLDKVAKYFAELGIPAPAFQATLVGFTELVCGSLLVIGLLSRCAAAPLAITMVVALVTAKREDIHGLVDLAGTLEFAYLVMLVSIVILGPGAASLDRVLFGRARHRSTT